MGYGDMAWVSNMGKGLGDNGWKAHGMGRKDGGPGCCDCDSLVEGREVTLARGVVSTYIHGGKGW